jgi:hypothetical protein
LRSARCHAVALFHMLSRVALHKRRPADDAR